MGPLAAFMVATLAYVIVPWIWAFSDGNLTEVSGGDAFLAPRMRYVFLLPFLFAAIANYYIESSSLLGKLVKRGIVRSRSQPAGTSGDKDALQPLDDVVAGVREGRLARLAAPLPWVTGVVACVLFFINGNPKWSLFGFLKEHTPDWLFSEAGIRPVAFYYVPAFLGVGLAIIVMWGMSHIRIARVLRALFRRKDFEINLTLLHPDGCMGLGPIGDLTKSLVAVLVPLSAVLFVWSTGMRERAGAEVVFSELLDPGILAAWVAYLLGAPLLFFLPLTTARAQMSELKERKLAALGRHLAEVDSVAVDGRIVMDDKIVSVYRRVQQAAVWPFTFRTVSSFVASFTTPVIIAALTQLVSRLLG